MDSFGTHLDLEHLKHLVKFESTIISTKSEVIYTKKLFHVDPNDT